MEHRAKKQKKLPNGLDAGKNFYLTTVQLYHVKVRKAAKKGAVPHVCDCRSKADQWFKYKRVCQCVASVPLVSGCTLRNVHEWLSPLKRLIHRVECDSITLRNVVEVTIPVLNVLLPKFTTFGIGDVKKASPMVEKCGTGPPIVLIFCLPICLSQADSARAARL